MQLTPRYLVNNRTIIIANEAGFVTEYRPVYSRQLKVYRGIDNTLEFKVLNADQKPIDIASYTPRFQAFDESNRLIIEHDGTSIPTDDSSLQRGLFRVVITENDLVNVKQQYLKYSIFLVNVNNNKTITYADTHFDMDGTIYISSQAFPGPVSSTNITTFTEDSGQSGLDDSVWHSNAIEAEPALNGNEALHTAVIYTTNYIGKVIVQATLDNSVTESSSWADIVSVSFDGSETEPKPVNFNGVYSYLRFKSTANPADKIIKILVRN